MLVRKFDIGREQQSKIFSLDFLGENFAEKRKRLFVVWRELGEKKRGRKRFCVSEGRCRN